MRVDVVARVDRAVLPVAVASALMLVPNMIDSCSHVLGLEPWAIFHHARGVMLAVMSLVLVRRAAENEAMLAKKSEEAGASASRLRASWPGAVRTRPRLA